MGGQSSHSLFNLHHFEAFCSLPNLQNVPKSLSLFPSLAYQYDLPLEGPLPWKAHCHHYLLLNPINTPTNKQTRSHLHTVSITSACQWKMSFSGRIDAVCSLVVIFVTSFTCLMSGFHFITPLGLLLLAMNIYWGWQVSCLWGLKLRALSFKTMHFTPSLEAASPLSCELLTHLIKISHISSEFLSGFTVAVVIPRSEQLFCGSAESLSAVLPIRKDSI